jgi:hypothetical protein
MFYFTIKEKVLGNDGEDEGEDDEADDLDEEDGDEAISYTPEELEVLLAKCLACISNRNSIESRSLLTGETGYMTVQVNEPPNPHVVHI